METVNVKERWAATLQRRGSGMAPSGVREVSGERLEGARAVVGRAVSSLIRQVAASSVRQKGVPDARERGVQRVRGAPSGATSQAWRQCGGAMTELCTATQKQFSLYNLAAKAPRRQGDDHRRETAGPATETRGCGSPRHFAQKVPVPSGQRRSHLVISRRSCL